MTATATHAQVPKHLQVTGSITNMRGLLHGFHYLLDQGVNGLLGIQPLVHGVIPEPCHLSLVQLAGSLLNVLDHLHLRQHSVTRVAKTAQQCTKLSQLSPLQGNATRI